MKFNEPGPHGGPQDPPITDPGPPGGPNGLQSYNAGSLGGPNDPDNKSETKHSGPLGGPRNLPPSAQGPTKPVRQKVVIRKPAVDYRAALESKRSGSLGRHQDSLFSDPGSPRRFPQRRNQGERGPSVDPSSHPDDWTAADEDSGYPGLFGMVPALTKDTDGPFNPESGYQLSNPLKVGLPPKFCV